MIGRRALLTRALGLLAVPAWRAHARPRPTHPDLSGVWTNAWYTMLERPKAFKALVATPAEAEAYEAPRRANSGHLASKPDSLGQPESEFPEGGPGLARIRGEIRTSWIVDPPDGKVPWIKAEWKRLRLDQDSPETDPKTFDNVEDRDTDERCITAPGGYAPILNSADACVMTFVQTPDHLVIVAEKNHQARIVRLGAQPAPPRGGPPPPAWLEPATGRWEGASLVVENRNYPRGVTRIADGLYLSDRARVTERFSRTAPGEIAYAFEVADPTLFTRPWRGEAVFRASQGQMFEYACHEGNYSLPTILAGGRRKTP